MAISPALIGRILQISHLRTLSCYIGRAAGIFTGELERNKILDQVASLKITLYGSLAATGKGHYTVEGLLMGMQGYDCETCDTSMIQPNYKSIVDTKASKP